jgi:hypothetical protein
VSLDPGICHNCGKEIKTMIFRMTGACSTLCVKAMHKRDMKEPK